MCVAFKSVSKLRIAIMLMAMLFSAIQPLVSPYFSTNSAQADAAFFLSEICSDDGSAAASQKYPASEGPANHHLQSGQCSFCSTVATVVLPECERVLIGRVVSERVVWLPSLTTALIETELSGRPFPPRAPPVLA